MKGRLNMTGVQESNGQFQPLPEGDYLFEIEEVADKETKNGDPMASITLVVASGPNKGDKVFDNIVIPLDGSPAIKIKGRTKHFLHCIGEPYEGDFEYNTDAWQFKRVRAEVKHEIQQQGKYAGSPRAVIASYILDEAVQAQGASTPNDIKWEE